MKKDELEERLDALRKDVEAEFEHDRQRQRRVEATEQAERERELAEAEAELDEELGHRKQGDASTLRRLRDKYDAQTALSIAAGARKELDAGPKAGDKSLLVSGALSFFLGPLGWLYAGSFREAIPASLAVLLVTWLLPTFLLLPIAGVALPLSGIAGVVYAWQHNRTGKRGRILGDGKNEDEDED